MATQPKKFVTVEEYIQQERTALDRHEYLDGEIFAMAGGTPVHSTIGSNILIEIGSQLRGSDCTVRNPDMRIRTSPRGLYSYADAVVSCADEQFDNGTLLNPVVIVEVLSESTESYDRGKKFELYRQIPSFREYLIVAQDRPYVEHHVREAVGTRVWIMREYTNLEDIITLGTIKVKLSLADIYAKVSFSISADTYAVAEPA
jgi:Uma2 family endonuclease